MNEGARCTLVRLSGVVVTYGCLRHHARRRRQKAQSDVGSPAARKPARLEGRERSVFLGLAAGVTALLYAGMVLGETAIAGVGMVLTIVQMCIRDRCPPRAPIPRWT